MNYTKQEPVPVWSRFWRCVKGECNLKNMGRQKKIKNKIEHRVRALKAKLMAFKSTAIV